WVTVDREGNEKDFRCCCVAADRGKRYGRGAADIRIRSFTRGNVLNHCSRFSNGRIGDGGAVADHCGGESHARRKGWRSDIRAPGGIEPDVQRGGNSVDRGGNES